MEKNEVIILDDRGFIQIQGSDTEDFLQNIITNDINKVTNNLTLFSSIFTPQGKYLYEFIILKSKNGYLLECEKNIASEIIKHLEFYKLRSNVDFKNLSEKFTSLVISAKKFQELDGSKMLKGHTTFFREDPVFLDPRTDKMDAKIISKLENIHMTIKKLDLKITEKNKYYNKSFELGIPQVNLIKLKEKIFGIENNLDELYGIDHKKGCYIGQENTSRIKLRNKLRRRILPVQKISGKISENDIIKYKSSEIGKILIDKPYSFALVKVVKPDLKEFTNTELMCGKSKVKILKPEWI